jgi:hypothetical protein
MKYSIAVLVFAIGLTAPGEAPAQQADPGTDVWQTRVVPTAMAVQGVGMLAMWVPILAGHPSVEEHGFFRAREDGLLLWPHVVAEVATAGALATAAVGLYQEEAWGRTAGLVALGALAYTSLNSLNWALAEEDRLPYAIPMFVGLGVSGVSIGIIW